MSILQKLVDLPIRVHVAAAGAGAGIQNHLWGVPGASKFLVGACFPYSKEDMTRFLGFEPEKFVSQRTALDMAISAYLSASNGDPAITPIGLGLTASVASMKEHRGEHRICCAAITRTEAWYAEVVIKKGIGRDARIGDGNFSDVVGLEVLLKAAGIDPSFPVFDSTPIVRAEKEAREAFFARPFFTRGHKRSAADQARGRTLFPGVFNPPHPGHFFCAGPEVVFQITANPPKAIDTSTRHKPALSLGDMLDRYLALQDKRDVLFLEDGSTYLEKARLYPGSSFVIGSDVVQRIVDPRWGHEVLPMFEEFARLSTRFQVGLREGDTFSELMRQVPEGFRSMFTELPQSPYAGMSSSQLRRG